ncbi:ABC transporter ATP-binding protein [Chachezhania sediminis]|uniref:ABC transporter ATP-binding protein n=1 Tax=Chachezhania sediminis TaxID=2599291 RepID=UPI00131C9547|nr:sn-glycerol-3-phosphate ABC transporter ATP-binding protein UgpC [Chachezhania sediminis]
MAGITIDGVRKVYPNGFQAIEDLSLNIPDGELVVLVGPSGCGKSTLLRMIAGLETISDGDISIGGRIVNRLEPGERDIAMVFQNYALYPHMTIFDNLAYGLRNRKTPKAEIKQRVEEAVQMLGIAHLLDRKPRQMSGGQRQRVAMGRAIVREPSVFLFDEPLSNLDAKLRVQMRVEIKRLQRQLKTTSVYVTHDQLEAMTLADTLVVMNAGRIEQAGTPMELYSNPATVFVATFIGSPAMNMLPGIVADGFFRVEGDAAGIQPMSLRGVANGPVILGVRPEHLQVGPAIGAGLSGRLHVISSEPIGAETLVYCEGPGSDPLILRAAGEATHRPGDMVDVFAPADRLHLFDTETGEAKPRLTAVQTVMATGPQPVT